MTLGATDWIAIYAAIIATGALFLEVRRWFEDQVHLSMHVGADMQLFNVPGYEDRTIVSVTVRNRGSRVTTLTNLTLMQFGSPWRRWKQLAGRAAVVPSPEIPGTGRGLPYVLEPGREWMGMIAQTPELEDWIKTDALFAVSMLLTATKRSSKRSGGGLLSRNEPPGHRRSPCPDLLPMANQGMDEDWTDTEYAEIATKDGVEAVERLLRTRFPNLSDRWNEMHRMEETGRWDILWHFSSMKPSDEPDRGVIRTYLG